MLRWRFLACVGLILIVLSLLLPSAALADPYPPVWGGSAVHFLPVAWPAEASWTPYTMVGSDIKDLSNQDPSNGGTSPQNYVNVSSGCADQTLPSIYSAYSATTQTMFFRWRVQTSPNTYATGPNAGAYSASDAWNSAQWTVLIDLNADGYRDFAVQLDGSSGSPSASVDRLTAVWSSTASQSVDYINDSSVKLIAHNPTAFVDSATQRILDFASSYPAAQPTPNWPNGASELTWDYGTTRSSRVPNQSCAEYLIDYQIPVAMLNASSVGGPVVTPNTPMALAFATANSLNNPLQKDYVYQGAFTADPSQPLPFGDTFTLAGGLRQAPVVQTVTAAGCGPSTLTATVEDATVAVNGAVRTSVTAVDFYYYADANGNGQPDDGSVWTLAAAASMSNNPIGQWTAAWNSTSLPRGQYLIGAKATDNQGNITWSYLTAAQLPGTTPPNFANTSIPGIVFTPLNNSCGLPPPSLIKAANPTQVSAGAAVQFTLTVVNPSTTAALTVSSIQDALPVGWTYRSTDGGTLGSAATTPTVGASGTVTWAFAPAAMVPANTSRTFIFSAKAPATAGTYNNTATATSSAGVLMSDPTQVGVGAPRLTLAKLANVATAAPGDSIVYTLRYSNDSPVSVTNAVLTDVLPAGLTFLSAANEGVYDAGTRTVTWNVGSVQSGDGPFAVTFTVTVDNPYPVGAAVPLVNTAVIDSDQTDPANAAASTFIFAPRPALAIQKEANLVQVAPGSDVLFTISYANTGNAPATGVTITDVTPPGFTYRGATPAATTAPAVGNSGAVVWNIGTLVAGATGSAQVTLRADTPFNAANPQTNTATISADNATPASGSYLVASTISTCTDTTYYFKNLSAAALVEPDVTVVPANPTQYYANTSAPPAGSTATTITKNFPKAPSTPVEVEIAQFYADPVAQDALSLGGNVTINAYLNKSNGPQISYKFYLYSFNPSTGAVSQLGSLATSQGTGGDNNRLYTLTIPVSDNVKQGNRLLLRFTIVNSSNQDGTAGINFDGASSPSRFTRCQAPLRITLNKQVDKLTIQPGGILQYTLRFANPGTAPLTGASLVDTLPSGVTFGSATLNGAPVTPTINGQLLTFTVNTPGQAAGTLAAGGSGTVVINVTVNQPLIETVSSLPNSASLATNDTLPVTSTTTTGVVRPGVTITKLASHTLLVPGGTTSYTLNILNGGAGTATNVTIADTLPVTEYFTYVPGSARLNGNAITPDPVSGGVLNYTLGSLASGASAAVTVHMQVASSGVPAGVTTLDNAATVSDGQTQGTRTSNIVTVSITSNPNLQATKSVSPSGLHEPGALLTYTISVTNAGGSTAADVIVIDSIPVNTSYVNGSMRVGSGAQTDPADSDAGTYNAVLNRVEYALGSLAAAQSRMVSFQVRVASELPAGTTAIANSSTTTSSNAATKAAGTSSNVTAATGLKLVKTGPTSVAFPAAVLAVEANNSPVVQVIDASQLQVGGWVQIGALARKVTAISGATVTLDGAISAAAGTSVIGGVSYTLRYANNGTAPATGVTLTDTLPVGTVLADASTPYSSSGSPISSVTWNVGTIAPGGSGVVQLTVFPSTAGALTNHASLASNEQAAVHSSTVTAVGGLLVTKSTSTPLVTQTPTGTSATYTIQVTNTSPATAYGVEVTDWLPTGFTYAGTTATGGNATRTATGDPLAGATQPLWGTWSIPGGGSLTITFTADVATSVGPATYQNSAGATASNAASIDYEGLNSTAEDVRVRVPAVKLAKSVTPTSADTGSVVRYTVTMQNTGDATAEGVQITDQLPAGFNYKQDVLITQTGAARTSTQTPSANATTPTWGTWNIDAGGSVSIQFEATAGTIVGTYYNAAFALSNNSTVPPISGQAALELHAPLAVALVRFEWRVDGPRIILTWETASETDLSGFHLFRGIDTHPQTPEQRRWVWIRQWIPAKAPGSGVGQFYEIQDEFGLGQTVQYELYRLDMQGLSQLEGTTGLIRTGPVQWLPLIGK